MLIKCNVFHIYSSIIYDKCTSKRQTKSDYSIGMIKHSLKTWNSDSFILTRFQVPIQNLVLNDNALAHTTFIIIPIFRRDAFAI